MSLDAQKLVDEINRLRELDRRHRIISEEAEHDMRQLRRDIRGMAKELEGKLLRLHELYVAKSDPFDVTGTISECVSLAKRLKIV